MSNSISNQRYELVGKRWAKALMELANENSGISKIDILDDLKEVADNIKASEDLTQMFANPSISTEEKQIVLCKLFEYKIMPIVYNFIIALNLRKRILIIGAIAEQFEKELERVTNVAKVDITSAIEIDSNKKDEIKNKLSEKLKKDVIVNWKVNSEIIGGLIFNIDETIIDNSIKFRLEDLCNNVKK